VGKKGCSTVGRRNKELVRVERCKRKAKRENKVIGGMISRERKER